MKHIKNVLQESKWFFLLLNMPHNAVNTSFLPDEQIFLSLNVNNSQLLIAELST